MRVVARAPNHLGDGIMALPALEALARAHRLCIHAPPWGKVLYAHLGVPIRARGRMQGDAAVLFAPSFRAAWEARDVPVVVGTPTDWRRWLLTQPIDDQGHRREVYARLAGALGGQVDGEPCFPGRGTAAEVPWGHVGLNPICKGGATREWPGFFDLACTLKEPVVFYAGPGEDLARLAGGFPRVVGASLLDFAATLQRCSVFVSNDSGAAHFARAVGVKTVVVHGSTRPERTGPSGAIPVVGPRMPCAPCYKSRCGQAPQLGCLEIGVGHVHRVVKGLL